MLPLMMMIWFAPALITQHRISPVDALRMSFMGCLRNILSFFDLRAGRPAIDYRRFDSAGAGIADRLSIAYLCDV